jgi:hypothetical protein
MCAFPTHSRAQRGQVRTSEALFDTRGAITPTLSGLYPRRNLARYPRLARERPSNATVTGNREASLTREPEPYCCEEPR